MVPHLLLLKGVDGLQEIASISGNNDGLEFGRPLYDGRVGSVFRKAHVVEVKNAAAGVTE